MRHTVRHFVLNTALIVLTFLFASTTSYATPVTQSLSKGPSSIRFGVESPSPTLQMNGQLKEFTGNVTLNPDGSSLSQLQVMINLGSAQLPPDQLLQGIFLHSVIARFKQLSATFRSTAIDHISGDEYTATGVYSWQNKNRRATIPFQLVRASPTTTEIRVLMRGGLTEATTPKELSAAAPGASQSSGWARATLVFVKPQLG